MPVSLRTAAAVRVKAAVSFVKTAMLAPGMAAVLVYARRLRRSWRRPWRSLGRRMRRPT